MQCEHCRQDSEQCQCVRPMSKTDHQSFKGLTLDLSDGEKESFRATSGSRKTAFIWQPQGWLGIIAAAVVLLAAFFIALPLVLI